jgi:hypothetical protein
MVRNLAWKVDKKFNALITITRRPLPMFLESKGRSKFQRVVVCQRQGQQYPKFYQVESATAFCPLGSFLKAQFEDTPPMFLDDRG